MAEWTIPPARLPEEPYTAAQFECYVNRYSDFLDDVKACITAGGTPTQVQACINQKYQNYLTYLPICDAM